MLRRSISTFISTISTRSGYRYLPCHFVSPYILFALGSSWLSTLRCRLPSRSVSSRKMKRATLSHRFGGILNSRRYKLIPVCTFTKPPMLNHAMNFHCHRFFPGRLIWIIRQYILITCFLSGDNSRFCNQVVKIWIFRQLHKIMYKMT